MGSTRDVRLVPESGPDHMLAETPLAVCIRKAVS
jgi:hypothetical protein